MANRPRNDVPSPSDDLHVVIYDDDTAEVVWPGKKSHEQSRDADVIERIKVDLRVNEKAALSRIAALDEIILFDEEVRISDIIEAVAEAVHERMIEKKNLKKK